MNQRFFSLLLSGLLLACGDDETVTENSAGSPAQGGSSGSSGQAGAGTAGAAGDGGAAGDAGTAGTGGAGEGGAGQGGAGTGGAGEGGAGGAGAGGTAGMGGSGGQAGSGGASCLPASAYEQLLGLEEKSPLCVVGLHKTDVASLGFAFGASWGRHGGPLSTDASNGVVVRRWTVPAEPQGAMAGAPAVKVEVPGAPAGVFFGPAFDAPFHGWTLLSYTGSAPSFQGELVALDEGLQQVKARAFVNGFFAGTTLAGSKARLLFTGLSPLTTQASETGANGLYYGDVCDESALIKEGCGASASLASWASSSGPVTTDAAGNLFAAASTFGANQQVRGFVATEASGSAQAQGVVVLEDKDYSTSLAALGSGAGGLLVVQASSSETFTARPAQLFSYSVEGGTLAATAIEQGGFVVKQEGATVVVFPGAEGELWVAFDSAQGAHFARLARK
ncbi:MAG: hypothetical protein MUF64_20455 [Polyangiaceae bacterium]|nr:hypothetical protein [Polyangiaceae bacterium]